MEVEEKGKTKIEKKIRFHELRDEDKRHELFNWWLKLQSDNGARAVLKRCSSPFEAALQPGTYQIKNILPWYSYEALATSAGILAHIKSGVENHFYPFGYYLAHPAETGGRSPCSETRFRQFLSAREWGEFFTGLRRIVKLLNGKVNPIIVADVIFRWDREQREQKISKSVYSLKFDLSNDYYSEIEKYK